MEDLRRDPLLRTLAIVLVAVLAFVLFYSLLSGQTGAVGYGSHTGAGHYGMNGQMAFGYGYGSGSGFSLTGLLLLVIKILFVFLIIGLVAESPKPSNKKFCLM